MGKKLLSPGFLFHPTDVELVNYYLKRKVSGKSIEAVPEVDIYKYAPWDLPDKSYIKNGDYKWYFFCPVEKKYGSGMRLIRATEYGYWKVTGKDCPVYHKKKIVGKIKTLVFHQGKGGGGDQTDWVMQEYSLEDKNLAEKGIVQNAYVLCVVFRKDGVGTHSEVQLREKELPNVQAVYSVVLHIPSCVFASASSIPQSQSSVESITESAERSQLSDDSILSMLALFKEESMIDSPEIKDDSDPYLADASDIMEGDDTLPMLTPFMEHDDVLHPTATEAPQLSDDSILSLLALFKEESTIDSREMEDDSDALLADASDHREAGDTLSTMTPFIEHDDAHPTSIEAPQPSDVSILSMLENFTEDSMIYSEQTEDCPLLVPDASDTREALYAVPDDKDDILSMLTKFI